MNTITKYNKLNNICLLLYKNKFLKEDIRIENTDIKFLNLISV